MTISHVIFQDNNLLNNFLVITKTINSGQVEESRNQARSSESEKLEQAVDDFSERLKACVEACMG